MNILSLVLGITGAVAGVGGLVTSIVSYFHNRIDAINSYYENERSEAFIKARRVVWNLDKDYNPKAILKSDESEAIAYVCLSFHHIGLLIRKKQMPFWVIRDNGTAFAAVGLYKILKPYIEYRQLYDNPYIWNGFSYLVSRIEKSRNFRNAQKKLN